MAWHILEKTIEHLDRHATLAGKFWITFFFIFRFLMVISIADTVFGDEKDGLICDTQTPGCLNVCYNTFTPISLFRFWALQLLCSALPGVILYVYIANKLQSIEVAKKIRISKEKMKKQELKDLRDNQRDMRKNRNEVRQRIKQQQKELSLDQIPIGGGTSPIRSKAGSQKSGSSIPAKYADSAIFSSSSSSSSASSDSESSDEYWLGNNDIIASRLTSKDMPPKVFLAYELHVILRMIIEIIFMVMQYYIYPFKFRVPDRWECTHFERPCLNRHTTCYIARPKEKTIFIALMYGTAMFMVLLSLYELWSLGLSNTILALKYKDKDITKEFKVSNKFSADQLRDKNSKFLANTPHCRVLEFFTTWDARTWDAQNLRAQNLGA